MASTLHPGPPLHPPPSFSRNSTGSSKHGVHASFDASQSVASTPRLLHPTKRTPATNVIRYGESWSANGMVMQRSGFIGFETPMGTYRSSSTHPDISLRSHGTALRMCCSARRRARPTLPTSTLLKSTADTQDLFSRRSTRRLSL
jgi:hypothetical protein